MALVRLVRLVCAEREFGGARWVVWGLFIGICVCGDWVEMGGGSGTVEDGLLWRFFFICFGSWWCDGVVVW